MSLLLYSTKNQTTGCLMREKKGYPTVLKVNGSQNLKYKFVQGWKCVFTFGHATIQNTVITQIHVMLYVEQINVKMWIIVSTVIMSSLYVHFSEKQTGCDDLIISRQFHYSLLVCRKSAGNYFLSRLAHFWHKIDCRQIFKLAEYTHGYLLQMCDTNWLSVKRCS